MQKLPLKNTETKQIPIAPNVKTEIRRTTKFTGSKTTNTKEQKPVKFSENESHHLGKPTSHTSRKILKVIEGLKNQEMDLPNLVKNKLSSPTTANYVAKKKALKTNVASSKEVFKQLVSLDISGTDLIKGIEEDLNRRAAAVQPPAREPDPSPTLADYSSFYTADEFLNTRIVGPSDIIKGPTSPQPKNGFLIKLDDIPKYSDIILG